MSTKLWRRVANGGTAPAIFILSTEWFVVISLGAHRTDRSACPASTLTTEEKLQIIAQVQCLYSGKATAVHNIMCYVYYIWKMNINLRSGQTVALRSTQALPEMSTSNILWGLRRPVCKDDNLTTFMCRLSSNPRVWTFWNPQELSRSVKRFIDLKIIIY